MKKILITTFSLILFLECSNSQTKPKKIVFEPKKSLNKEIYFLKNGGMHGQYSFFYNGKKQVEGNYLDDSKTGEWKYYDQNGNIRIKGYYQNDKRIGTWYYYDKNVLISKLIFDAKEVMDTFYGFWPNGNIAHKKIIDRINEIENSIKYYQDNKVYEKSTKVLGKLDGIKERFDKNGKKVLEIEYKNDNPYSLISNIESSYFSDSYSGNLSNGEGTLKINKLDSTTLTFKPYIELDFKNGLRNGNYLKYHTNGKFSCRGQYLNNYLDGTFEFYDENGSLDTTIIYQSTDTLKSDYKNGIYLSYSDEYFVIEKMPKFLENDCQVFRYHIQKNLRYPEIAAENGIQGKVFVQFSVNGVGKLEDIKIVKSVDESLDKEVLRVVNLSPYWEPGFQYFLPVKVQFTFPVIFMLQ